MSPPPPPTSSIELGSGVIVTSTSVSLLNETPFAPIASASADAVPRTTISSPVSPRLTASSISAMPVDSALAPGASAPPDWSTISFSTEPTAPLTEMESVLAVVAAPHAVGVSPKWISPPTTASVAVPPAPIPAVTDFVAAL